MKIYQGDTAVTEAALRNGRRVLPLIIPHGGLRTLAYPGQIIPMARICDVVEISDGAAEFVNEREVVRMGKRSSTLNDGVTYTFTFTVDGNSVITQALLQGVDPYDIIGVTQGATQTNFGHLQLVAANPSEDQTITTLVPNVDIKLTNIAGATDGESNIEIEFTTSTAPISLVDWHMFVKDIFFDGTSPIDGTTTIVNADAPDGALTTFRLGQGNDSTVGTKAAAAVKYSSASGVGAYIYETRLAGVATSPTSYDTATSTIGFGSAPADGAILEVLYPVRTGAETWNAAKSYGIGKIVSYNGAFYKSIAAVAAGVTPSASTPWSVYVGFGTASDASVALDEGQPVVPYETGVSSFFLSGQQRINN